MERKAYQYLRDGEGGWWYVGRFDAVAQVLARTPPHKGRVLDFGAGRGAACTFLAQYGTVDAYEVDAESSLVCKIRPYQKVYDDASHLAGPYSLIAAFDVIEHIDHDVEELRRLRNLLEEDGLLVITVPAYPWLWSAHDEHHKHFRRYTKKTITEALTKAGYTVEYRTYWNMVTLPLVYILRLFGGGGGEALTQPPLIEKILSLILSVESKCIRYASLPWGSGLVVLARK